MRLRLVVLTPGKSQGKSISVTRSPFVIGRDDDCQLRPASTLVSHRHCALVVRDGRAFVRDLGSTNGTFLNDQRIEGEQELAHGDWLTVGPLDFDVHLTATPTVTQRTPAPPSRGRGMVVADEELAALLLAVVENGADQEAPPDLGAGAVPEGETRLDINVHQPVEWEAVGDAVAVHFTEHKILDDHKIRLVAEHLRMLLDGAQGRKIVFNLGNVRAMSSGMVDQLATFAQQVRAKNGRLVLCNVHPLIAPVFRHLGKVFDIRRDEQEALQALR
jgi:anti-anti-sigma factor